MIKIVNDNGATLGTKILSESGEDICGLLAVESLVVDFGTASDVVRAKIVLGLVKTEVSAENVEYLVRHPVEDDFRAVSSIKFCDGSEIIFCPNGDVFVQPRREPAPVSAIIPISDGRARKFKAPPPK